MLATFHWLFFNLRQKKIIFQIHEIPVDVCEINQSINRLIDGIIITVLIGEIFAMFRSLGYGYAE
jgi:hypothetical protein